MLSPSSVSWIQSLLQERFGIPFTLVPLPSNKSLRITLEHDDRHIEFPVDAATFSRTDSNLPCSLWNALDEGWTPSMDPILYAPGACTLAVPLIRRAEQGYRVNYDIIGLIYWMLSRREEFGRADLDNHGRFPAISSHAYKYGYLERPIVDEWLHILGQVILRTWPGISLKQPRFTIDVSHDVDRPSRYTFQPWRGVLRSMVGDILKRGTFGSAIRAPWIRITSGHQLHPDDPANTFDWLMNVSERHGLRSAFYFICGRTAPKFDADYEPEHPAIRALMRSIHQRGHEIGLHPSYDTYQRPDAIVAEAIRLRTVAESENIRQTEWGGRMHFLRWEHPTTMRAWNLAGLDYDSTLGYADSPGFRCGTCFEYQAFDAIKDTTLNLRLRPLVAMDVTITDKKYLGLGCGDTALVRFLKIKSACKAVGGKFTLLWHNSQLMSPRLRILYEQVLAG